MTSWSIDSGDTLNTVETVSVSGHGGNSKQPPVAPATAMPEVSKAPQAESKVNATEIEARRRNDVRTPPPSPPSSPPCTLPRYYQIERSTEIDAEDRAFFGISAPRGRSDRSHRTVRFRFGVVINKSMSNHSGTKAGRSVGEDEEHELVLSWSVRTGKRIMSYDRIMVYSITLKGAGVVDHTVLTPDGKFSLRLLCCTEPPLGAAPNFETSELLINGVSYFDLPRMGRDGALKVAPSLRELGGSSVGTKSKRKIIYTVGEALCPDAIERSRQEAGFEDEET